MFEPLLSPLFSSLFSPLIAQPIPITRMDLISNLFLQRGAGVATFTRSTIGTYDDRITGLIKTAVIDEARFETNGVLIEGESTNEALHNLDFTDGVWSSSTTVTSNTNNGPDGTLTADNIEDTSITVFERTDQTMSIAANNNVRTLSVYLQETVSAASFPGVALEYTGGTTSQITVNTDTGVITDRAGFSPDSTSSKLIKDYYRVALTENNDGTNTVVKVSILGSVNTDGLGTWSASTIGNVVGWSAQLEQLSFASSIITTTATAVSRGQDNLSIDAANITAPAENYTISVEVDILGIDPTKTQTVYSVDGETSRKIEINTTTGLVEATHGAVTSTSTTALVPGTKVKIVFTVGDTNQTLYIAGTQEDQDVKGTVTGTATAISIGNAAGADQLFGKEKFFEIFAKELTPGEVKNL